MYASMYVSLHICVSTCVSACACFSECTRLSTHVCASLLRAGILPHLLHCAIIAEVRLESCNNSLCSTTSILHATHNMFLDCGFPIKLFSRAKRESYLRCIFHYEAFMAVVLLLVDGIVCEWQGYGKRAAPLVQVQRRCHALQRFTIGYFNDRRDRAWRPCQVIKDNKAHLGSLLSGVGLGLAKHGGEVARHGHGDESRCHVRHAWSQPPKTATFSRPPRWVF